MKYIVDRWIHAHYNTEVEANSFEEALKIARYGGDDDSNVTFNNLDVGDSGITCIIDENGKEYWCE